MRLAHRCIALLAPMLIFLAPLMAERPDARHARGAPQQAAVFIWPGFLLASADAFNHRMKSAAAFLVINLQLLLHTRAGKT